MTTTHQPSQQPGMCPTCDGENIWLLVYEDQDMEPVLFSNHGADEAARKAFEHAATKWTVRLFKCVAQDGYGPGTGQQPGVCPGRKGSCRTGSGYLREDCPACNGTGQQPAQPDYDPIAAVEAVEHYEASAKALDALDSLDAQPGSGKVKREPT